LEISSFGLTGLPQFKLETLWLEDTYLEKNWDLKGWITWLEGMGRRKGYYLRGIFQEFITHSYFKWVFGIGLFYRIGI